MRKNPGTRAACASALVAALLAAIISGVPAPAWADEPAAVDEGQEAVPTVVEDAPDEEALAEDEEATVEEPAVLDEPLQEEGSEEAELEEQDADAAEAELEEQAGPSVTYCTHCQSYGWMPWVSNGAMSGTSGQSKRVEALEIKVNGGEVAGGVQYRVHCQTYGWTGWVADGALAGTTGEARRVEALQIRLTGSLANQYDVWYRVHVQSYGWLGWAKNGAQSGTQGLSKRVEAIEIVLVKKGGAAPGGTSNAFIVGGQVSYRTHCQTYGWRDWVADGALSGTTGEAKRVEALEIQLGQGMSGGIQYRVHAQSYGWMSWQSNGAMAGTSGQSKRVEAIQIKLTGAAANSYDVYYRVHAQSYGWLGWAKNGQSAGTEGLSKRVEAIEIVLVKKGGAAPGSTDNRFVKATQDRIMGQSQTSVDQMVRCFNAHGIPYPSAALGKGGAPNIRVFCQILYEEAQAEGVRAEVVFAQAMLETGWLRFGGDVKISQFNFAGLGATGNGVPGNSFPDVRTGLRAQVQHLKAYASTAPLNNKCVDVRFGYVERGCAPTIEQLSQRWAVGADYGNKIKDVMHELLTS